MKSETDQIQYLKDKIVASALQPARLREFGMFLDEAGSQVCVARMDMGRYVSQFEADTRRLSKQLVTLLSRSDSAMDPA